MRRTTCFFAASVAALTLGCGLTGSSDSDVLETGRYGYAMQAGTSGPFGGDLVISQASASSVVYRWFVPGYASPSGTAVHNTGGWAITALLASGRVATHTVSRSGNGYHCTVSVVLPGFPPTNGTCSLSYEGPDSLRAAP